MDDSDRLEQLSEMLQPYGVMVAGALFGGAWWCWLDAITFSAMVLHSGVPALYYIPGVVATLAVIIMGSIRRNDAYGDGGYGDEGATCRARCGLFTAYVLSFGAIVGSVAVLLTSKQRSEDLWLGVSGVLQCALLAASGLLFWLAKSNDDADFNHYSFI